MMTSRPEANRLCPLCGRDNRLLPPTRYSRDGWLLKECTGCRLVYLENPPPLESLTSEHCWSTSVATENQRRLQGRPAAGRLRAGWKKWRRRWLPSRKLDTFVRRYVATGNLLDVGCSWGDLFVELPSSIVPYGIEIDPRAAEGARLRVVPRGGSLIEADALSGLQSMPPDSMRGIVMQSFLEHDTRPLETLREAARVVTADGVIILKVPNLACWNRRYWHGAAWPGFRFPDHVNYFTPQTLTQMVIKAGLRIRRCVWRDRLPTSDNIWLVAVRSRRSC